MPTTPSPNPSFPSPKRGNEHNSFTLTFLFSPPPPLQSNLHRPYYHQRRLPSAFSGLGLGLAEEGAAHHGPGTSPWSRAMAEIYKPFLGESSKDLLAAMEQYNILANTCVLGEAGSITVYLEIDLYSVFGCYLLRVCEGVSYAPETRKQNQKKKKKKKSTKTNKQKAHRFVYRKSLGNVLFKAFEG